MKTNDCLHKSGLVWMRDKADRQIFDKLDMYAMMVLGLDGETDRTLWLYAKQVDEKLIDVQAYHSRHVKIHHLFWVNGRSQAMTLHKACCDAMEAQDSNLAGYWFSVDAHTADAIARTAADQYMISLYSHGALFAHIAAERQRILERDLIRAGLFAQA